MANKTLTTVGLIFILYNILIYVCVCGGSRGWGGGLRKIELFFICPSQRQIVGVHTPIHKIKSIRFTKPNKYAIKHEIKREFVRDSRIDVDVGVFP